ncbi:MAG TPA: heavy-metal-associated domain-containing protein [Burkholderiales bacterium]|nr:heavy-metal-associated domain-containing protein [Burkholderiales bacterium]
METVAIEVKGMTCNGCVASVSRVLKATPGVAAADVTLVPARATVTFDPAQTDLAALRGAIEDAGYDVAG